LQLEGKDEENEPAAVEVAVVLPSSTIVSIVRNERERTVSREI
jgi:hypothetical protein